MSLHELLLQNVERSNYRTRIRKRFVELIDSPKFNQIVLLIDMEGVILPQHFPRLICPEIYSSDFNPYEDKITKIRFKSLANNNLLLDLLKNSKEMDKDNKVLIMSASQMELAPLPKKQQPIDRLLAYGLLKTHDILNKVAGESYHEITERFRIEDNSLLIDLDDSRFSPTLMKYLAQTQPGYNTFSALPVKIPVFNIDKEPNYEDLLYKSLLKGLFHKPISMKTLEINEGIFKRQSYNQPQLNLHPKPLKD